MLDQATCRVGGQKALHCCRSTGTAQHDARTCGDGPLAEDLRPGERPQVGAPAVQLEAPVPGLLQAARAAGGAALRSADRHARLRRARRVRLLHVRLRGVTAVRQRNAVSALPASLLRLRLAAVQAYAAARTHIRLSLLL